MKFNITHNMQVSRPHKWSGDYIRRYGSHNQGFNIEADSIDHAETLLRTVHNINPFYTVIKPAN